MTVGFRSHGVWAAISSAGYNQENTVILNYNRFSNETTFRFSPLWTALTSVTYGRVTETKGRNVELFQSSCNMDSSLLDSDLQTTAEGLAWTERPKKTMEISRGLNIMLKRFFDFIFGDNFDINAFSRIFVHSLCKQNLHHPCPSVMNVW